MQIFSLGKTEVQFAAGNLPREKRRGLPRERTMICCTCEISGRLSSFRSHGVKNRFLKQEIVITMRKCAISVRTQIFLSLHNVKSKTSVL